MLGKAHKIISKKDSTVIVDGKGKKTEFDEKNPNAGPKKMSLQQVRQFIDNGFK